MREKNSEDSDSKAHKLSQFFFPSQPTLHMVESPIPVHRVVLIIIRVIGFLFFTANYFVRLSRNPQSLLNQLLYLTNNGYFYTWLYFTAATQYYILKNCIKMPKMDLVIQLLFQNAICFQFTLTLLYWVVLFESTEGGFDFYIDLVIHALPLLMLFIDFIFCSYRFPSTHLIIILLLLLLYGYVFNLPFSVDVEAVYAPVDWRSPLTAGLIFGTILLQTIIFLIGKGIFHCCKEHKLSQLNEINNEGINEQPSSQVQI